MNTSLPLYYYLWFCLIVVNGKFSFSSLNQRTKMFDSIKNGIFRYNIDLNANLQDKEQDSFS